jgi:hypothetical protein
LSGVKKEKYMKKILFLSAATMFLFSLAGCELFKKAVDYFPVGEGYTWKSQTVETKYDSTYNFQTEEWDISYDTTTKTSIDECIGETTLDDSTAVWEFMTMRGTDTGYSYIAFADEEVEFYASKADTAPLYTMPKKLDVGSKWHTKFTDTTYIEYEVIGTEDVTVPAGTYKGALKITITYPDLGQYLSAEGYQLWDKDEGIVKTYYKFISNVPGTNFGTIEDLTELQEVTR